jgi:hypothetical protein
MNTGLVLHINFYRYANVMKKLTAILQVQGEG